MPESLCCVAALSGKGPAPCDPTRLFPTMINVILALVPLLFAAGSLAWLMTSGAEAQARSDAWAAEWVRKNG